MGSLRKIRVLICDDSALIRKLLSDLFSRDPELEVVASARDPYEARELIKTQSPDVLTLDVEMPRMDGLTFLGHLMRLRPMPVVMISSLTDTGAEATLTALELGAIDYVHKPNIGVHEGMQEYAELIIEKVKTAARARVIPSSRDGGPRAPRAAIAKPGASGLKTTDRLIAIGASTGGTEAVAEFLSTFPPDAPGTVVVQHIPEVFSRRFAERLDASLAVSVSEARDGDRILLGHVYIAPGNKHLRIVRNGAHYHCAISDDPAVNRHRPSVDVLFRSAAEKAGRNATGVILTGMGKDGAEGLLEMRNAGSMTFAQDEESSVVWGMPGEAVRRGAACEVLPLSSMAARVLAASSS